MKSLFKFYDDACEDERCGFIVKPMKAIELKNIFKEPTMGFEIDPEDTLKYIDNLKGIWHTHPKKTSVLSGEDKLCIEQWPNLKHYIIGNDGIRTYVVKDGIVTNENYLPR